MKIRVQSADMDTVVEVDVLKLAFQAAYEQTQPLKLGLIVEFNSADLSDTFYMSTEALLDEMGVQYKSKGALAMQATKEACSNILAKLKEMER